MWMKWGSWVCRWLVTVQWGFLGLGSKDNRCSTLKPEANVCVQGHVFVILHFQTSAVSWHFTMCVKFRLKEIAGVQCLSFWPTLYWQALSSLINKPHASQTINAEICVCVGLCILGVNATWHTRSWKPTEELNQCWRTAVCPTSAFRNNAMRILKEVGFWYVF